MVQKADGAGVGGAPSSSIAPLKQAHDPSNKAPAAGQELEIPHVVALASDSSDVRRAELDQALQGKKASDRAALDQVLARFAEPDGKVDASKLKALTQQLSSDQAPVQPASVTRSEARTRADEAWRAMEKNFEVRGHPGKYSQDVHGKSPSGVWEFGQAIAAALDRAKLTGNYEPAKRMFEELNAYRVPGKRGFAPYPGGNKRWYDDNSWIGLDFMQAYSQTRDKGYLHDAENLFKFIRHGQQEGGGMIWDDHAMKGNYNMPATASSSQMALELYEATGKRQYLDFARKNIDFMNEHLLIQSGPEKGLYVEGVVNATPQEALRLYRKATGQSDATSVPKNQRMVIQSGPFKGYSWRDEEGPNGENWVSWAYNRPAKLNSYNQGTGFVDNLLLAKALEREGQTGEAAPYMQQARETVHASLDYFKGHTLWKDQAAFNGIFFRNLMQYRGDFPNEPIGRSLETYLDEAWTKARDGQGVFHLGGIGLFNSKGNAGDLLDQAALVQLFTLDALAKRHS